MRSTGRIVVARIVLTLALIAILGFAIFKLVSSNGPSKPNTSKTKQKTTSQSNHQKDTKKPQAAKLATPTPAPTPAHASTPAPAPSPPPTSTSPPTPSPSSATATSPATGKNLTNSGPGDVVALFMGTLMLGALLHNRFIVTRSLGKEPQ